MNDLHVCTEESELPDFPTVKAVERLPQVRTASAQAWSLE